MKTKKRMLGFASVLLAITLSATLGFTAFADEPELEPSYNVVIDYVFEDNTLAAQPYVANVKEGFAIYETIPSPAVPGYEPDQPEVLLDIPYVDAEVHHFVYYIPSGTTTYTVRHMLEDEDGLGHSLGDEEILTAITGETVTAAAKPFEGFTPPAILPTATVAANGATTLEVKYQRNGYVVYFDTADGTYIEPRAVQYGADPGAMPADPTRDGYDFTGWDNTLPATMPAHDVTLTAQWDTVADGTEYAVVYWVETIEDGVYEYGGTALLHGTAGDPVPENSTPPASVNLPLAAKYLEYNEDKTKAANPAGLTIRNNGSTIQHVYMDRKLYVLTFNTQGTINNVTSDFQIRIGSTSYSSGTYTTTAKVGQEFPADKPFPSTVGGVPYNVIFTGWKGSGNASTVSPYTTVMNTTIADSNGNLSIALLGGDRIDLTWNFYLQNLPQDGVDPDEIDPVTKAKLHYTEEPTIKTTTNWPNKSYTPPTLEGFTFFEAYDMSFPSEEPSSDNRIGRINPNNGKPQIALVDQTRVNMKLYYNRNSYTLTLHNGGGNEQESALYEAPLENLLGEPTRPVGVDASYAFLGWYTSEKFVEGTKVDPTALTMPAGNLALYARWDEPTYTVTFKPENGEADFSETVNINTAVLRPADPVKADNTFLGWYKPGSSLRYVFSLPVNEDFTLEARWAPETNVDYDVHYIINDDGGVEQSRESETRVGFAVGDVVTERARVIDNYLPDFVSKSLTLTGTADEIAFEYAPFTQTDYVVKYLEQGTDAELLPEQTVSTTYAMVTETYRYVEGYNPVETKLTLQLSQNEGDNEIVFYYYPDGNATFVIEHYLEKLEGGYELKDSEYKRAQTGTPVAAPVKSYANYTYNAAISTADGLADDSLVLEMYYDLNTYSIQFLPGNGGTLSGATAFGGVKHGTPFSSAVVVPTPKAKTGYEFTGWSPSLPGGSTAVGKNATYTAQWKKVETTPSSSSSTPTTTTSTTTSTSVVEPDTSSEPDPGPGPGPGTDSSTSTPAPSTSRRTSSSSPASAPSTSAPGASSARPAAASAPSDTGDTQPGGLGQTESDAAAASAAAQSTPSGGGTGGSGLFAGADLGPAPTREELIDATGSVNLFGNEVPLGSLVVTGGWSLLSLIFSVMGIISGAAMALVTLARRGRREKAPRYTLRFIAAGVGALPLLLFLLLDSFSAPMVLLSRSFPFVLLAALAHVAMAIVAARAKTRETAEAEQE